jgi:ABC-type lipoprotein release transport system permease subunit
MGLVGLLAFLATKGLGRSRVTTALLLFAVTAGVGLQIPNSANLRGYTANLFEEATTRGFGDVRVHDAKAQFIEDGDAAARDLSSVRGVRAAVPIVSLAGALETSAGRQQVTEVHGIDPSSRFRPYRIRAGVDLAPDDEGVLVGTAIAARHGIAPGDVVRVRVLLPPSADVETYGSSPTVAEYTMTVRGTAAGTFGGYQSLFVTRGLVLRAMGRPHVASRVLLYSGSQTGSLGVSTASREAPKEAEALAGEVAARKPELRAATWMAETPYADSAIRANETLGIVSHTMVVVAVTIPIAALLFVAVEGRRREIAMLAALGFRRREIFASFILQSIAVGLVGAILGCAVGWLGVRAFDAHPIFDTPDFTVRPVIVASTFYEPALFVVIATALAAIYPAYRATKVDPARVLRGLA